MSASLSPREDLEYVSTLIEDGYTWESFDNFTTWALDKAFQHRPKLGLQDLDFILDMVRQRYDESGWIDDMYVISSYSAVTCFQ